MDDQIRRSEAHGKVKSYLVGSSTYVTFFNLKDDYMELQKENKRENSLFLTNCWKSVLGDAERILCLC